MTSAQAGAKKTGTAAASSPAKATGAAPITDQAVLEYLKSKGMGMAVMELTKKIKEAQGGSPAKTTTTTASPTAVPKITKPRKRPPEPNERFW